MRYLRILITGLLAIGLAATVLAQEQSLGDVARKNRKSGTKKVLSNEDLPTTGGISTVGEAPAPAETSGEGAEAAPAEGAAAGEAAPAESGEGAATASADDSEIQTMEERLKKLEYDEAGLARRIGKMEEDMENAESEFRREMYRTGLENARSNLDTIREQKAATEKALADAKEGKPSGEQAAATPE